MQEVLIETITPGDSNVIYESSQDGKNVWLSGIFMQSNCTNRNNRNYPLEEMQKAVDSANKRIVEQNGIFGELDHPQTLTINLDRISHVITDMRLDGSNAIGKAKLLETPMGQIARELVKSGVKIGVSSRGAGQVGADGKVSDFNLVTIDLVATPSAPEAIPNVVYESLQKFDKSGEVLSLTQQLKHDDQAQKYFREAILDFINETFK